MNVVDVNIFFSCRSDLPEAVKQFRANLRMVVEDKVSDKINDFHVAASLLDPRFKDIEIDEAKKTSAIIYIKKEILNRYMDTDVKGRPAKRARYSGAAAKGEEDDDDDERTTGLFGALMKAGAWKTPTKSDDKPASATYSKEEQLLDEEIASYFKEEGILPTDSPSRWWYQRGSTFPLLSKLNRVMFMMPSQSSVLSESLGKYLNEGMAVPGLDVNKYLYLHENFDLSAAP